MFLALNELRKEKLRYILIVFVIFLVSYLVFFLTGLAYGLATSYTQGIDKWNAGGIILQKDANNNIARSLITKADYSNISSRDPAPLGVGSATIDMTKADDAYIFGIETYSFLAPNITEGRAIEKPYEVIVDDGLKDSGISLNNTLKLKGSEQTYMVVGFTDNATFQTAPIVYMQLDTWRLAVAELAGMTSMRDETTVSALVTKSNSAPSALSSTLSWLSIRDFAFTLPGYNAQVLTFSLMIGFLIAIASLVLAVFMYVLTLQKKGIFGVLKAEGIPNAYIARSVILQTLLLSAFGLILGLFTTIVSAILLGQKVPFLINPLFFGVIAVLFLMLAALGSLTSVRSVTKIDPVEAIG